MERQFMGVFILINFRKLGSKMPIIYEFEEYNYLKERTTRNTNS